MEQPKREVKSDQKNVRSKIQEIEKKLNTPTSIHFTTPTSNTPTSLRSAIPTSNTPISLRSVILTSNTPTFLRSAIPSSNTPTFLRSAIPTSNTPTSLHFAIPSSNSPTSLHFAIPTSTTINNDSEFRPVTPTDQIIGSLWDDINTEMEKYKQSKQYQSDPNLSPRTNFGSCSLQEGHSISSYRSQSVKRMGQSTDREGGTFSSSGSLLAGKRQRTDDEVSLEMGVVLNQMDMENEQANVQKITAEQEAIMKRLHEAIIVQQDQICQASRALAFCRQNERFRGSREEIDAQRALLVSTERRRALLTERERVIGGRLATENDLKGTLTFSAIAFKLSREYIAKYIQNSSNTSLYYFIVLIKCGENVFHTTLASSDQGIRSGFIEFSHYISVSGLSPDFSCELEVYSLKAGHDLTGTDRNVRGKKGTWRRMVISTPLNAYTNSFSTYSSSSSHRPIGVMDPGFQRVGHLTITRHMVQQQKHLLSHLTYPLEGTVVLNLDCHPDTNSLPLREYRSFLSLYELVSELSSWTRYWCSLGGGQLRFWRYPEDEVSKSPCVQLDLSRCVSQVIAVPSSAASFPNSMQVDVVRIDEKTHQREGVSPMLFAADTPEEREHWMDCINQAIRRSNVWRTTRRK